MSDTFFPEVTILLQGILSPSINLLELVKKYSNICPVKLALYTYQIDEVNPVLSEFPNISYVINDQSQFEQELIAMGIPERRDIDEYYKCYFQISSLLHALDTITTPYTLFCRIDHDYSSLQELIQLSKDTSKFTTSSLVVRGSRKPYWRFHFSDCLIFGQTKKLIEVLDLAKKEYRLDLIDYRPNECRIWRPYFAKVFEEEKIDSFACDDITYVSTMTKYMNIIPVCMLSPFRITSSNKIFTEDSFQSEYKSTPTYLLDGTDHM